MGGVFYVEGFYGLVIYSLLVSLVVEGCFDFWVFRVWFAIVYRGWVICCVRGVWRGLWLDVGG